MSLSSWRYNSYKYLSESSRLLTKFLFADRFLYYLHSLSKIWKEAHFAIVFFFRDSFFFWSNFLMFLNEWLVIMPEQKQK